MRIGIIACEILRNEIEQITADDEDVVHREYLEMGLHDFPERLRDILVDKVNSLRGKVDIVFIGYARCKTLDAVPAAIDIPYIMLREEDCIGAMLGPLKYAEERSKCPGTWFSSPGWAKLGLDAIVNQEQIKDLTTMGYDQLYFAKKELEGYTRCLYLDTGITIEYDARALAIGLSEQLNLKFESMRADCFSLRDAWKRVKEHVTD